MNNDSTIPSRLDPMQTVPAPLSGMTPLSSQRDDDVGSPVARLLVAGVALAALAAAIRYAVH